VLVVVVTLFGMTAIFFGLFSQENAGVEGIPRGGDQGPLDALWWSLKYVVRLPAFAGMYGATAPILIYSAILSILGLAVFGMLVSLINNSMRTRVELLRRGDTMVKERGHLLILGWNNKIFSMLRRIARLAPGARVVILAQMSVREMADKLRVAGVSRERLSLILRSGVPTNPKELERMNLDHAGQVIVLSGDAGDSDVIKILVLLANWRQSFSPPPIVVAEIAKDQNYELAEIAAGEQVQLISSSRVTSKIIVQTLRNPGLSKVYDEIMSADGNSLFVEKATEQAGLSTGELVYGLQAAIPVGISWLDRVTARHKAGLNPEPDYDLAEDESVVLLASAEGNVYSAPAEEFVSSLYRDQVPTTHPSMRVLLIGWSNMLEDILSELNAHSTMGTEVVVLSLRHFDDSDASEAEKVSARYSNLSISFHTGDATQRSAYEDLNLAGFDSIAVLVEGESSAGDPDSETLRILLRLSELRSSFDVTANIVVELVDVANRSVIANLDVRDVVVNTEVISAQLAQIARQPMLGSIYRELLSAGGVEISLRAVTEYVETGAGVLFWDLVYAAQQRAETALGVYLQQGGVKLNPDRSECFESLTEHDRLIVLAEQIYR